MKHNMKSDSKNQNKNFMVQGTILAGASIIVRLIGMIYRIPLTGIIGDEGMGLYGCAFEVYNIALLLSSYSLPLAVSKLVSARLAKGENKNAFKVFKGALLFAVTAGLIISLVVFVFSDFIAEKIMDSHLSAYALRVLAPCLFIVAVMGVVRGFFQGHGNMVPTAVSQVIEQIVNAVVSVVAASYLFKAGVAAAEAMHLDADSAKLYGPAYGAAGGTLGTITGAFAGLVFLIILYILSKPVIKRKLKRDRSTEQEDYSIIFKVLFATIIPVVLSSALYNICGILDQIIFNHTMSARGMAYSEYTRLIGMYSGKFLLLINVPLAMANALASSSIPSITASIAKKAPKRIIFDKINITMRVSMIIAVPSFVGYVVLGSPILKLLWGDDRRQMALILAIGAISVVFYSLSTISNAVLQGLDHMKKPLKNAFISLVIHLGILYLLLLTGLNIYAVVIANSLFSLTMCILNQRDIRKVCGYRQEYRRNFFLPFIASVIMAIIAWAFYKIIYLVAGNTVATILALIIAVIVYATSLVRIKGVTEEELLEFPKGKTIVRILRKIKVLRD